ncbi:MAG: HAMP domain-containing sensor histidine kinase [Terracoccus sp.]
MSGLHRWRTTLRPLLGIRARSTAAAILVVAIGLVVGASLLLVLLRQSLVASAGEVAATRAVEVVDQVRSDGGSDLEEYLAETNRGAQLVQLVGPGGVVLASSSSRASGAPVSGLRPADGEVVREEVATVPTLPGGDPYMLVARGLLSRTGQPQTVLVASSLATEDATVDTVQKYVLGALLPLLLLVGTATWVLVGRALRPVEQIRTRVQGINAAQFEERVPIPDSSDEIARLAVTMNEMLDRLESAQQSQRRFVADASHELRSPLATLTAALEVAGPDPSGTSWDELRSIMAVEADRMRLLVADLLLLARADDTGLGLEREDVDLDDIVDAEVGRLRMSTSLHVHADIEPVRVHGDTAKLAQVVRNLVDNAARAASREMRLSLRQEQDTAVVVIDDDGPGIEPADRERVFDRFVRLDESRERGPGGSGLGLAIVAEVVRGHGGTVSVGRSDQGGARFEVRLPLS